MLHTPTNKYTRKNHVLTSTIEAVDRPFISLCNPRWWDPLSGHFPHSFVTDICSLTQRRKEIGSKIDAKELEVDSSFLIAGFLNVHSWAWYRVGPWLLLYISCSWRRAELVPPSTMSQHRAVNKDDIKSFNGNIPTWHLYRSSFCMQNIHVAKLNPWVHRCIVWWHPRPIVPQTPSEVSN